MRLADVWGGTLNAAPGDGLSEVAEPDAFGDVISPATMDRGDEEAGLNDPVTT